MILTDYRLFVFGQDIHSGLDLFDELSITKIIPVILPAIFGLFWIIWTSGNSLSWGEALASMETSLMRFAMLVSALSRLSLIPLIAVVMVTFTSSYVNKCYNNVYQEHPPHRISEMVNFNMIKTHKSELSLSRK